MSTPKNKQNTPNAKSVNAQQDATLPQITIDTKFNQGYTVASPVNGGGEAVAVCNKSGMVELFTQGTDGTIWNFYPDATSDTGYNGVSTSLKGTTFNAGTDSNGNIVVFASLGMQLDYIVETPGASTRWSNPTIIEVPKPKNPIAISSIFVQDIAGTLYVGVLTSYQSMTSPTYAFAYSIWNPQSPSFTAPGVTYSSLNCVWIGNSAQTAAVACVQGAVATYTLSTNKPSQYPMSATFTSIAAASTVDNNGNSQIFTILADGNVNQLVTTNGGTSYYWVPLSQGMTFRSLGAALDSNNGLCVFAVSGNNQLYNWIPESGSQSGFSNPAPIAVNVALMGLAINDGGAIDLFTIGTSANNLNHVYLEEVSMDWASQQLEVPSNGVLQQFISYSTDITACDATGVPMINAPVSIYSAEECHLSINGSVYFVNQHEPAYLSTNNAGIISVCQQTGSLAIPVLEINYTGVMPPATYISIDPSANVQDKLAVVTGTDLMNAKDMDGTYMIGDEYRTPENTDSMAQAFNSTMTAVGVPTNVRAYPNMKHGAKKGVWLRDSGTIQQARQLNGHLPTQHWQLRFEGKRVIYQNLTEASAKEILDAKKAIPRVDGFFDWIGDIGDVLSGVVDGIINIVDVVVDAVGSAINAAITFVIDGVTYLLDTVITIVEQALDLIETIFAQVLVFLEKVWEWIGFLFSWPDILRTHEAISYSMNQFMGFLGGSLTGMQSIVDANFSTFQGNVAKVFQDAITNIAGNYTIGGYNDSNAQQSPDFETATSNNIVYSGIVNNPTSVTSSTAKMVIAADDPMLKVLQDLLQMGISAEASAAFSQALTYFQNLGTSPDQIFSCLLAGLLSVAEGVVLSILSGVQNVVDELLALGAAITQTMQNAMNEEWNIPVISQLYSFITGGSDLTTLDLIALLMAIPVTFTYKIIYGKSPFPDGNSVTTFKNSFNAQSMLSAAGFGGQQQVATAATKAVTPQSNASGLAPQYATFFATISCISTTLGGWITAVNDAFPKDAPSFLSKVVWIMESCSQVASFPWWTSTAAPSCNPSNVEGSTNMLWLFMNVGVCMDAVFIKIEDRIPESTGDAGIAVQLLYAALGHTTFAVIASIKASGSAIAYNVMPVIPELCKLLKFNEIVVASDGISLGVLAAIDALLYTTTGILGFINATSSPSSDVVNAEAVPVLAI